jgi:MinD superfamily P-loop ATPase
MKQLTVISGKGGTGKTTIMAALAALAKRAVLVDADVDAADLHLLLHPQIQAQEKFMGGKKAVIDLQKCDGCQKCVQACRFGAIANLQVDPLACEGCGVCYFICPRAAINLTDVQSGEWFISQTRFGPMVHAKLGVAQENSGKLVTLVRKEAVKIAQEQNYALVLIDGPPGIGCPVIASLGGVDAALVVTEPSLSGIHDLERILNLCGHFNIPAWVSVNKADINHDNTQKIKDFCQERGLPVISEIPFDPSVTKAMIKGLTVVEYAQGAIREEIGKMWNFFESALSLPKEKLPEVI